MSRKAMKKTLERLRSIALKKIKEYNRTVEKYKTSEDKPFDFILYYKALEALESLYTYVESLEDAYSEFAEPFDKKLEKMEKAVETMDKVVQKKDEGKQKKEKTKKTQYIG